ncbi:MAG TPA: condensation domain-containing protein, partial [Streptosporangiaceae bacterium]
MTGEMTASSFSEILPLAPLQRGLLFEHLLAGETADAYLVQLVLSVRGPLDHRRLRTAAELLLARHANLRAGFLHDGLSQPVQVIPHQAGLPWRELDRSGTPAAGRAGSLASIAAAEQQPGFDLRRPPAMRFAVIRWSPDEHSVIFTHHHILLDGWSLGLFAQQLFELYEARGAESALPPQVPYRELFSWLSRQDQEAAGEAWRHELDDVRPLLLGRHRAAGPDSPANGELNLEIGQDLSDRLAGIARGLHLTASTMFLGMWGIVLGSFTGSNDVVFGTTISGRSPEIQGIESAVGLYANTIPVRVSWSAQDCVADVLTAFQTRQLALSGHNWMSLADIQELSGQRSLFDTLAIFANYPAAAELGDTSAAELAVTGDVTSDRTHYALDVLAIPGDQLRIRIQYSRRLCADETAEALAGRLVRLMEAVAAEPRLRVSQIDLLGVVERGLVVGGWNETGVGVVGGTLPGLFGVRAGLCPDVVAVVCGGER